MADRFRGVRNRNRPTAFSPPSGPIQWLFQWPPAQSKFLAPNEINQQAPQSIYFVFPSFDHDLSWDSGVC
jgi:hypothetical protein